MKRFVVSLVLLTLAACSQTPIPEALSELAPLTFGSSGFEAAQSLGKHSSGVYAAGYTDGNLHAAPKGGGDAFVRKYDTFGAVLWGKQFGTPSYDNAQGVAGDGSNNAYVVGETYGSLAGSRGGQDGFIRKYTSSGGVAWTKQFGTGGTDSAQDVATFGTNVVYVTGYTTGNLAGRVGSYDAYLIKYTAAGGVAWTRQFGTSVEDLAQDVAVDGSGNAYVVGYTYGSFPGFTNGGGADMFIRRYNTNGTVAWTRQLNFSDQDVATAVAVSGSNVYLTGYYQYSGGDYDVPVLKYTTSGTSVPCTVISPSSYEIGTDITADSSGVAVSGYTDGSLGVTNQGGTDGFVYKFNSSCGSVWAKHQGTSDYDTTNAVLSRGSGQLYTAGYTYGLLGGTQSGNGDAFLRRLSGTTGNTVWTDQ